MKRNDKSEPLGDTRGGGNDEAAGTLPLPLHYSPNNAESQTLSIGQALRLRDAMIILERRLAEARAVFEADIAEVLKGGGDD